MSEKQTSGIETFRFSSVNGSDDTLATRFSAQDNDEHFSRADDNASDIGLVEKPNNIYQDQFTAYGSNVKAHRHILRAWAPEIISTILGIVSLLFIVIILKVYEGRVLNSLGLPKYLTLNGLIAAIATLLRVFIIIPVASALSQEGWLRMSQGNTRLKHLSVSDAASRGAWGSLMLLVRHSDRKWVTSLGALVTISSLAIGTFTQQLIATTNVAITSSTSTMQPGNIAWSNLYKSGSSGSDPGLPVKAAAYNGFLSENVTALQAPCPSGNCTFPETPSVAMCADCVPTTNMLSGCHDETCNYTTSLGNTFTLGGWLADKWYAGDGFQAQLNKFNNTESGNLVAVDFEMLGVPYNFSGSKRAGENYTDFLSQRCQIWFCVNVYRTSVSDGQQQQTIVESYADIPNTVDTIYHPDGLWNFTLPERWKKSSNNFSIQAESFTAMQSQLSGMVVGNISMYSTGGDFWPSGDIIEAMWHGSDHARDWIQQAALSLTNIVRPMNPGPVSSEFDGVGFTLGVSVRWLWLTLPAALTVMSITVLAIVIVRTARSDLGVWKDSPLTMLLFDIDRDLQRQFDQVKWNALAIVDDADSHVADTRVTLWRTPRGRFQLKEA